MDYLLRSLRRYYDEVKTKRQLQLDTPAGFRQTSTHNQLFQSFTPPRKTQQQVDNAHLNHQTISDQLPSTSLPHQDTLEQSLSEADPVTNRPIPSHVPIL